MQRKSTIRIISLLLCIVMLLSVPAMAVNADVFVFKDNDANYFKFISGFGDGTIRPDAPLTRAQCAKMLSYVIDVDDADGNAFSDVPVSFWGYDAISALSNSGLLYGYSDGSFKPDKHITRAEFATIIARITSGEEGSTLLKDISGHWAQKSIEQLVNSGIINGYADNTFRPDATITRAEAVKLINRFTGVKLNENAQEELFSDLPVSHWAYYEIMSAVSTTHFESPIDHDPINFNEIEYIDLNVPAIENEFDALLNEFLSASPERQGEIFNRISAMESDIALAITMSNINSQRDVTSKRDRNNIENAPAAFNAVTKAKERRYKFLSFVKDEVVFEKTIGMKISDIPAPDEATPDRLVELYTEEQEYENDFNTFMYEATIVHNGEKYSLAQGESSDDPLLRAKALNYYVEHKREYGEIFTNLISVRTRIANFYGYRYYTDLGYMRAGKFYYTPEDVAVIREDVKKYLAPLYYNITMAARGHDNGYYNLNTPVTYYLGSNKTDLDIASDFLRQLSPQTREAFDFMTESKLIDSVVRENKATSAFTTYIGEYEVPFVFMNETGGVEDIETLSHEFGHAFHSFRIGSGGISCPPDVAEIASYGMEMLSLHNYDELFGAEAGKKELLINFYYKLQILLLTTFLDEFQYMVYKDTLLTAEERNALYASLYKEYFIGASFNHEAYNKGIIWSNPTHIFKEPYYAIDYSLAFTVALQLWEIGVEQGFDKQFETYMCILESPYINTSVHSVALSAGMKSPFEKGVIQSVSAKLEKLFKIE